MGVAETKEIKLKLVTLLVLAILRETRSHGDQPLSRISIHNAVFALHDLAYVTASPTVLGLRASFAVFISLYVVFSHFCLIHIFMSRFWVLISGLNSLMHCFVGGNHRMGDIRIRFFKPFS